MTQDQLRSGRPITVDVFADPDPDSEKGVKFSHDWRFDNGPQKGNTAVDLPRDSGSHKLHFHLHDRTSLNLAFAGEKTDSAEDAMWVCETDYPKGKGNGGGQIDLANGHCSKNLLRVEDANSGPSRTLIYQLWFDGANGAVDYDPEIRNGGGGTGRSSTISALTVGVAAAAVVVIVLVALYNTGSLGL